jgi:hypothetical protein
MDLIDLTRPPEDDLIPTKRLVIHPYDITEVFAGSERVAVLVDLPRQRDSRLELTDELIERNEVLLRECDALVSELRGLPPWLRRAILAHGYRPILREILTTKESK